MSKFSGLIASIGALGFVNSIAYSTVILYPLALPILLPFIWESVKEVINQYEIVTKTAAVKETNSGDNKRKKEETVASDDGKKVMS